jgi:hypothetical protein
VATTTTARPSTPSALPDGEGDTSAGETEGSDITVVRPRVVELYSIELWREGVRQTVVPITKPEITIGRGSKSVEVDLPLKGDPEISRVHCTLTLGRSRALLADSERAAIPRSSPAAKSPANNAPSSSLMRR